MSLMDEHIQERLAGFAQNDYKSVSNCFIYQFGPYMCMTTGYENEVDQISKFNPVMRLMQHAAYVIRLAPTLLNRRALGTFIKDFLVEVFNNFPGDEYESERDALNRLGISYLNSVNSESVMTNIAPIVLYQQSLQKPEYDIEVSESFEIAQKALELQKTSEIESKLHDLLIRYLPTIMVEAPKTRFENDRTKNLHEILLHTSKSDYDVETYYIMANFYYMEPNTTVLESELSFYNTLINTENQMDSSAFEAFINGVTSSVLENEWEDSVLAEKEQETVEKIIGQSTIKNNEIERPMFNLNCLYNFIAMNRFMQFDNWSKRYFVSEFRDRMGNVKITNVNPLGNGADAFEINTDMLVVPFVDLRDYQVKFIYIDRDSDKPYISTDFIYH